jgi:hypothetical protein
VRAQIEGLRSAWRLYKSEDRVDTYIAVGIAGVVLGPVLYRVWRQNRR